MVLCLLITSVIASSPEVAAQAAIPDDACGDVEWTNTAQVWPLTPHLLRGPVDSIGWDAGGSSVQQINGDGGVSFSANLDQALSGGYRKNIFSIGLTRSDGGFDPDEVDYSIRNLQQFGAVVFLGAENTGQATPELQSGDQLRIERVGTTIRFFHNGELFHSVSNATTDPLFVDASFLNEGNILNVQVDEQGCSRQPTPTSGVLDEVDPIGGFNRSDWVTGGDMPNDSDTPASGAFRFLCFEQTFGQLDPIVHFGEPELAHHHTFWGNAPIEADSTYESLRQSNVGGGCPGGPANNTGYWMPTLIDPTCDTGSRCAVPFTYSNMYYKFDAKNAVWLQVEEDQRNEVKPLPRGLRMVAGAGHHGVPSSPANTFGWKCAEDPGTPKPSLEALIESWNDANQTTCEVRSQGQFLVAAVSFPMCYSEAAAGVPILDSDDHRSHMAYKVDTASGDQRKCPDGMKEMPAITEFMFFDVAGEDLRDWYLDSDEMAPCQARGCSLHADWYGAWDEGIQMEWLTLCIHGGLSCAGGNLGNGERLAGPTAPNFDVKPPKVPLD